MRHFLTLSLCLCILSFLFTSCEKDEFLSADSDSAAPAAPLLMHAVALDGSGEITSFDAVAAPLGTSGRRTQLQKQHGSSLHTSFKSPSDNRYNISAMVKGDIVLGEWNVKGGTIADGNIYFKTVCLYVSGNEATVAGIVTESVSGALFQKDDVVWLRVKDNGEGRKSPEDQHSANGVYTLASEWKSRYGSLEALLADLSCEAMSTDSRLARLLDTKGQVQVR